jgi:hypothetical protein
MNAAKKAKSEFVKIADDNIKIAESIKHISLDEFVRALPTGQSRLSFTARGQQQLQEASSSSSSPPPPPPPPASVAAESGDK